MNPPISRSSALLLFAGAVAIFLLGALTHVGSTPAPVVVPPAAAAEAQVEAEPVVTPTVPDNLSPGLAEVVKLAQHHVDEGVILAYIKNSGQRYAATADDILYLTDLGVSQAVIEALLRNPPASTPPAPTAPATMVASAPAAAPAALPAPTNAPVAPVEPTPENFYTALAPYGTWLEVPKYGMCWQPTTVTVNPDWHPYVDQGQWLYTDNGWYWQSGYTWGSIAFHYGRWTTLPHHSHKWVWVPDNVWGPAWVSWRISSDQAGWAPLPPGVSLAVGSGLMFNNHRVSSDFDFNIPAGWYAFVANASLQDPNLAYYALQASSDSSVYAHSIPVNNYSYVNHKIVNKGPGPAGITSIAQMPAVPIKPTPPQRRIMDNEKARAASLSAATIPTHTELAAAPSPRPNRIVPVTTSTLPQPQRVRTSDLAEGHSPYTSLNYVARAETPAQNYWERTRPEPAASHESARHETAPIPGAWIPPVEREAPRAAITAGPVASTSTTSSTKSSK
jgi:hypothetical protein